MSGCRCGELQALSEEYTKDKGKVYYKWISDDRFWVVELPLADVQTFEVIIRILRGTPDTSGGTATPSKESIRRPQKL